MTKQVLAVAGSFTFGIVSLTSATAVIAWASAKTGPVIHPTGMVFGIALAIAAGITTISLLVLAFDGDFS
jgi:hypothetical protein